MPSVSFVGLFFITFTFVFPRYLSLFCYTTVGLWLHPPPNPITPFPSLYLLLDPTPAPWAPLRKKTDLPSFPFLSYGLTL